MSDATEVVESGTWQKTACILCECNCGVEVRLGGDGRTFERVRGDKAHPASKGYTCEKALRLDYYQNGRGERLLHPLRRRPDGTYEEIDWDTAIREVAERLAAVRDAHGGEAIVYYGGGGQGNHLGGTYGAALRGALGVRYTSRSRSCSASWPSGSTRPRRARTRNGRCCCRRGSAARSRPTRSCAIRRGGRRIWTVLCVSRRPMRSESA